MMGYNLQHPKIAKDITEVRKPSYPPCYSLFAGYIDNPHTRHDKLGKLFLLWSMAIMSLLVSTLPG